MFWADDSESAERGGQFAGAAAGTQYAGRHELVLGPVPRRGVGTSPVPPVDRRKAVELATSWRRRWLTAARQPEW